MCLALSPDITEGGRGPILVLGPCEPVLFRPESCRHCPLKLSMPPARGTCLATGPPVLMGQCLLHILGGVPSNAARDPALPLSQVQVYQQSCLPQAALGPLSVPKATTLLQLLGLGGRSWTMTEPLGSHQPEDYMPPVLGCLEHPWCPLHPSIL